MSQNDSETCGRCDSETQHEQNADYCDECMTELKRECGTAQAASDQPWLQQ